MRRMIVVVLIVGVLMLGTFAVIEKVTEGVFFCRSTDFSDSREAEDHQDSGCGDPTPEGGHQGGGGDVPG